MEVPIIKDGDFSLYESHAIMKYICASRNLEDYWYPKNIKQRAIVDQYLDWHHTKIRRGCADWVFKTLFGPKIGKIYT